MASKKSTIFQMLAFCVLAAGIVLMVLVAGWWDWLITYQFKPTVRPFLPVIIIGMFVVGLLIALMGLKNLIKPRIEEEIKAPGFEVGLAVVSMAIAVALPIIFGTIFYQIRIAISDGLFDIMIIGSVLIGLLSIVWLVGSVLHLQSIKTSKKGSSIIKQAIRIPLLLLALVGVIGGIFLGTPDAECVPFPEDLPFKIVVYEQGYMGYNTFKIPTMITTQNGTILAFAEARKENKEDFDKMDMVLRKSYDGGFTWTPMQVVISEGDLTIGNTCPVIDRDTGTIWVIFCKENDWCFKMKSEDQGESWSTPIEITSTVKLETWDWYATGPSHGIQLEDGTLVIPADHIENFKMSAHVIFSKDRGETWELGGTIQGAEECTLVELKNGTLYLNMRPMRPGYRGYALSNDKGITWTQVIEDTSLPDPMCEGNLLEISDPYRAGESLYLFSNAANSLYRENMTIRVSDDECRTWSHSKVLYEGLASYSALTLVNATGTIIGCLFEAGCNYYAEQIVFTRFPLSYIYS